MDKSNFIIKNNISIRAESKENSRWIEGIIPYNSKSVPMFGITEIIDKTAFRKTLADKTNVKALFNHDDSKVLGTTDNGTLELENSDDGLLCRCKLPNTSYANDLFEIVSRGDVKTLSFGFIPIKWEDDHTKRIRTLKEVKLDEVSYCVSYAAYPETNSQTYMRKINMESKKLNELLEKKTLTETELNELKNIAEIITNIIKENSPEKEDEAARAEPPEEGTPKNDGTSPESKEDETEKEAIKQEILGLIDTLFEIEKETSNEEEKEETNE